MIRARLSRARNCTACNTRLPAGRTGPRRHDLCRRCYSGALRVLLRPCRN